VTITLAVADVAEAEAKVRRIVAESEGTLVTEVRAGEARTQQARDADLNYYAKAASPGVTSRVPTDRVEETVGKLTFIGDVVDRKSRGTAASLDAARQQQQRSEQTAERASGRSRAADPATTRRAGRADSAGEAQRAAPQRASALRSQEANREAAAPRTTLIVRFVVKKVAPKAADPPSRRP
jgi:hypothetical protein